MLRTACAIIFIAIPMKSNAQFTPINRTELEELVYKYAPQIRHHSQENYHMASMDWYLPRAKLVELLIPLSKTTSPRIDREQVITDAVLSDSKYADERFRITRKLNVAKYGDKATAKTYVHVQRSIYQDIPYFNENIDIQYWFFYPHNGTLSPHEGDWEYVTITVDSKGDLKRVFASSHGNGETYGTQSIKRVEGRDNIVIYSANQSHAMYNDKGYNHRQVPFGDPCDDGGWWFNSWEYGRLEIVEIGNKYEGYNTWDSPRIDKVELLDHQTEDTQPSWLNFLGRWGVDGVVGPKKDTKDWLGVNPIIRHSSFYGAHPLTSPDRNLYYDYQKTDPYASSVIAGPSIICGSAPSTYLINSTEPVDVQWSAPSSTQPLTYHTSGNNLVVEASSVWSKGWATVFADITTDYGPYKISTHASRGGIWVGKPGFKTTLGIVGPSNLAINTAATFEAPAMHAASSFLWIVPQDWSIIGHKSSPIVELMAGGSTGLKQVIYRSTNTCGSTDELKYVNVTKSGKGGGPVPMGADPANSGQSSPENERLDIDDKTIFSESGIQNLTKLQVYPNPAKSLFKVYFDAQQIGDDTNFELLNINGQLMFNKPLLRTGDAVDVSGIENGVYVVRISGNIGVLTTKMIIRH